MANKKLRTINAEPFINLARRELVEMGDNLILHTKRGYSAFNLYEINAVDSGFQVYKRGEFEGSFSTTKTALAYCIADKNRRYNLAQEIRQLDEHVRNYDRSIEPRLAIARRSTGDFADILISKIQHRKQLRYQAKRELEKCVNLAKYLQLRGFQNDTQRTRHNGTTKTSR